MAHKDEFLTFYIVLTDPALVKQYQDQYPLGVNRAPYNPSVNGTGVPGGAAIEFQAPFRGYTDPMVGAPYSWTPWSGYGTQGGPYPLDVATFQRKSGGFLGLGGTTTRYYWLGKFVLAANPEPEQNGTPIPVPTNLAKTRWLMGFEEGYSGPYASGATSTTGRVITRDAARHVGGFGLALRGPTDSFTVSSDAYVAMTTAGATWERMYLRLRRKPASTIEFWKTNSSISPASGVSMGVTASGQLAFFNVNAGGARSLMSTFGQMHEWDGTSDDDAWILLDLFICYKNTVIAGLTEGAVTVYINHELAGVAAAPSADGLGAVQGHTQSQMGNVVTSPAANILELDVDDWVAKEIPRNAMTNAFEVKGKDFLHGSKIVKLRPTAFSGGNNWSSPNDLTSLIGNTFSTNVTAYGGIGSGTSGDLVVVDTDSDLVIDADNEAIGVNAIQVHVQHQKGAAGDPKAGYKLNLQAAVDTTVAIGSTGTREMDQVIYRQPGTSPDHEDVTPVQLRYVHAADTGFALLFQLTAQVELCGLFSACDYRASEEPDPAHPIEKPKFLGQHNAPYWHSQYVRDAKAAPIAPHALVCGTYVGTGNIKDLTFRCPVQFLAIRRNTSSGGGFFWWTSMLASHRGVIQQAISPAIHNVDEDPTFAPAIGEDVQQQRYRVRINTNDGELNANGETYTYTAFCDPGMRYSYAGAFVHHTAQTAVDNPFVHEQFAPEFGLFSFEEISNTSTSRLYGKGLLNAAATIARFAGGAVANAITWGVGKFTSDANAHGILGASDVAYILFRRHDGNNDPGEPGVLAIVEWTGDGAGSRTVGIAPASGKRPAWAMVFGESGTGFYRDISHTANNSTDSGGALQTNGITGGGVDSISVGAGLNANGVVYTGVVFLGGAAACNAGWSCGGEFVPTEPHSPIDGPWPAPPNPDDLPGQDPTPPGQEPPTVPDDMTTDLDPACKPFTTKICNLALARIGHTKKIDDLEVDQTLEADQARLHYGIEINQVLRDFPWSFATRYANLVLVAGTATVPVNGDWQYSYRAPADMMFARRIVGQGGQKRAYDAEPIPFREGSDASGNLIYTDAAIATNVPVTLEYTVRLACPASSGDAMFRSALAWKLGARFAATIARDAKKEAWCEAQYERQLLAAATTNAQEQQQEKPGDADWITGRN